MQARGYPMALWQGARKVARGCGKFLSSPPAVAIAGVPYAGGKAAHNGRMQGCFCPWKVVQSLEAWGHRDDA